MTSEGASVGRLRVYLGAAPGVGTTCALLVEGRRRAERGTDVVLGAVQDHGRAETAALAEGVERVGGGPPSELDLDAVLSRRPAVALVDELAHENPPGSRNLHRWQDVAALLHAGIDVVTTVEVAELESMRDVVEELTGRAGPSVPDWFVRGAEQIQLVDQTPEALRRRLAHGNVFPPEQVDAALADAFRVPTLAALRELALLWLADRVDDARRRAGDGGTTRWETRERVVVALTGAPGADAVVRRAGRMADRQRAELVGVHVRRGGDVDAAPAPALAEHRRLLESLGGTYHEVAAPEVAEGLVRFATTQRASQLVIGATRRSRWAELTRGSIAAQVLRLAPTVDLHVVAQGSSSTSAPGVGRPPGRGDRASFGRRRRIAGWSTAVLAPPLVAAGLWALPDSLSLDAHLLVLLVPVVAAAGLGGVGPAGLAALSGFLLANYLFTPPVHTLAIDQADDVVALAVFGGVAVASGAFVSRAARRTAEAAAARSHAETLASLAGTMAGPDPDPTAALLEQLRTSFGATGVGLYRRSGDGWTLESAAGPASPDGSEMGVAVQVGEELRLCLSGVTPSDRDRAVLDACADSIAVAVERRALQGEAERAERLAAVDALRSGVLAAVSHDLRTPLSVIKANAATLRDDDLDLSAEVRHELLAETEVQADRLTTMVADLTDLGRLQVGATRSRVAPTSLAGVVAAVVGADAGTGCEPRSAADVRVAVSDDLPDVLADRPLLERVVANLVDNAAKHAGPAGPVTVDAAAVGDRVVLRVSDRGPGVPEAARPRMFDPYERLGDSGVPGSGLGLAVVKGFCDAMGAEVRAEDTPGGGLSMTVTFPVAP